MVRRTQKSLGKQGSGNEHSKSGLGVALQKNKMTLFFNKKITSRVILSKNSNHTIFLSKIEKRRFMIFEKNFPMFLERNFVLFARVKIFV